MEAVSKPIEKWTKEELIQEIYRLGGLVNNPHIEDFLESVGLEAAYQQEHRNLEDHHKSPFDWFWTCGYLCQKAASAAVAGDLDKALHHTISTSALMANWHRLIKQARDDAKRQA